MTISPKIISAPAFRIGRYDEQIQALREACAWAGIDKGRASQYDRYIRELFENKGQSKEHMLALNESFEVVDIWIYWKDIVEEFPGLLERIRDSLQKGPLLREGENPATRGASNKPRNDAFVYLLSGVLVSKRKDVLCIDGIGRRNSSCTVTSDVVLRMNQLELSIECKRPNSEGALNRRTKEARSQIDGRPGVIAIDCSSVVRPPGKVIEKNSGEAAEEFLSDLLKEQIKPKIEKLLLPNLLGFILFARSPAMTPVYHSRIVAASGIPLESRYRPDCIATWLLVENSNGAHVGVLERVLVA